MPLDIAAEEQKIREELQFLKQEESIEQDSSEEVVDQVQEQYTEPQDTSEEEIEESQQEQVEEDNENEEEVDDLDDLPEDPPQGHFGWANLRKKAKKEKERADELEKKLAALEGKIEGMSLKDNNSISQNESKIIEEDLEPDKDIDPDGWRDWKIQKLESQLEKSNKTQAELDHVQRLNQARTELIAIENSYKDQDDEYESKIEFLRNIRRGELTTINPNATEAQIQQELDNNKLQMASHFAAQGVNAAQGLAQLAENMGYQANTKKAPKKKVNNKALKKNMDRSASLNGIGNEGDPSDALSPEQLNNMSLDEMIKMQNTAQGQKAIQKAIANSSRQ